MDKKELKFYEAPACEVVELKIQGMLCASPKDPIIEDDPKEPTLPKLGEDDDL